MAGSHRATRGPDRALLSGPATAVVIALVMVPLVWFAVARIGTSAEDARDVDGGTPSAATATPPGTPTPTTATADPTPLLSPTPTPRATPTPQLPRVAPSSPRRLASGSFLNVGFDNATEPRNGSFRAVSTAEVTRWESRGTPASPGTDTVYVIGNTRADGASAFATLPRLKPGSQVTIRTDRGRLTYTVTSAADRPTGGLANNDAFAAAVPGRLILVGLRIDSKGERTGTAYVVVATLSAAAPI